MTIVIPMAGASERFTGIGMSPKYMLKLKPFTTLFDAALESFKKWYDTANFIVIVKDAFACEFAESHLKLLKVKNYKVVNLDYLTRGQAESVYLGLQRAGIEDDGDELMVFNIDTIRYNLEIPEDDEWDSLFDAFYDDSDSLEWSFAKVEDNSLNIIKTAEKKRISCWCSTGLYIFRSIWLYNDSYERAEKDEAYNFYIAPLYNYMKGMKNKLLICDKKDVDFSGTPSQYYQLIQKLKNEDTDTK